MHLRCSLFVLAALTALLAGCARYPVEQGDDSLPTRVLVTEITLLDPLNPAYYYFLALDTDNDPNDGPVPVVTGPEQGNGWGTISGLGPNDPIQQPPFFVMCNNGAFQQYLNGQPIGSPYAAEILDGGTRIRLEIDLDDVVPDSQPLPDILQLNWITMKDLVIPPQNVGIPKEYDGIGALGSNYVDAVPTDQTWVRYSGDDYGTPVELPGDTTETREIDLIGWRVEVRLR